MIECDARDLGAQGFEKCHADAAFVTTIGFAPEHNPICRVEAWWRVYLCPTHAVLSPVDLYLAGRLPVAWARREPSR